MPRAKLFAVDVPHEPVGSSADLVRELARQGSLAERIATASGPEYTRACSGAYAIAWPVVFERLTRRIEYRRGHVRCARSVRHLEPDCFDMFQDDVEAVLHYLFRNAKTPIRNLEGWIASRLNAATVDGNRRRRGERGALQRPRLPKWLDAALGRDPWLTALAVDMLVWVGVATNVGTSVWPYGAWAERRVAITGDPRGVDAAIVRDIDMVLAAMRTNMAWYEKFVERPLGRKRAPVLSKNAADPDHVRPLSYLALTQRHELDDARLLELAAVAVAAIEARLGREEDPRTAVVSVLTAVFGSGTGGEHMDMAPGAGPAEDERVAAVLADQHSLERIVSQVLDVVSGR